MKAGLLPIVGLTLLQLVAARAPFHEKHQHLHDKRGQDIVQVVVTDNEYLSYESEDVIVYIDAEGNPVSTVTTWSGQQKTVHSLQTSKIHSTSTDNRPPPPPTSTSSSTPPPPPPPPPTSTSKSSSAAPSPAAVQEKIAQLQVPGPYSQPTQSSAAQSTPSVSSGPKAGGGGAKGVAYNTPGQATQISGISWACNWGQKPDLESPPFDYVPQLWGKKDGMCESFAANAAGAKSALFYNEPDMDPSVGGSGIDVGTTISDFTQIMVPLQKQGKTVSTPCVANSNSAYMDTFLSSFPSGSVDILCFHWYGPDLEGLKSTVETFQALASKHGVKQMWMNEWAVQPAPNDLSSFTSYLNGKVDRYAYNMNYMGGSTGY